MNEVKKALETCFNRDVYKIVLSKPKSKESVFRKVVVSQLDDGYHLEKFTDTQVFAVNLGIDEILDFLSASLSEGFLQYNGWDDQREYILQISKKGKVSVTRKMNKEAPQKNQGHNRAKNYILSEGQVIEPLVDMGIFTREGKVVNAMYDKFKQINRFVEIIDDEVKALDPQTPIRVIDFGCGKSYLTFIVYYYLTEIKKLDVRMVGLDLKKDVIEKCNQSARKYGYSQLTFELGDINTYESPFPVDMVITLHACDTATDYALYHAVKWNARFIFSVPCCQHEANGQIKSEDLSLLTKFGIVKERLAALMTDAIRGGLLEVCGYKVQLLEFVDLSHTPKNILIRGKRVSVPEKKKQEALREVEAVMAEFTLEPTFYQLLKDEGRLG